MLQKNQISGKKGIVPPSQVMAGDIQVLEIDEGLPCLHRNLESGCRVYIIGERELTNSHE